MCGRFNLSTDPAEVARHFELEEPPRLFPRYNIAPTQPVVVVRRADERQGRRAEPVIWGLVPFWAKDTSIGSKLINARSETAATKPAFRAAMKYRRCLVPATGFYEWQKQGRAKQPYFIHLKNAQLMGLGGLWERWQGADGSEVDTCTILTTDANELLLELHDRMPVIIPRESYGRWLDPSRQDASEVSDLMKPFDAGAMDFSPVSTRVNNVKNDDPSVMEQDSLF